MYIPVYRGSLEEAAAGRRQQLLQLAFDQAALKRLGITGITSIADITGATVLQYSMTTEARRQH